MKGIFRGIVFGAALLAAAPGAQASPAFSQQISNENQDRTFAVPPDLRGRVDFWKDVFTRYGKFQQVIHHREFPQIRFGIIDYSLEGASMHPVEFEKFKKVESERRVKEVTRALENLAKGNRPANLLEDIVARAMKTIPGGKEKYRRAIDEDLVRTQTGIRVRMMHGSPPQTPGVVSIPGRSASWHKRPRWCCGRYNLNYLGDVFRGRVNRTARMY